MKRRRHAAVLMCALLATTFATAGCAGTDARDTNHTEAPKRSAAGQLPEGFPDKVPFPDGARITRASTIPFNDAIGYTVEAKVTQTPEEVAAFYSSRLTGYTQSVETTEHGTKTTWQGTSDSVTILVTRGDDPANTLQLAYSKKPAT